MKIVSTQFNIKHMVLEIYVSGCKGPYCKGCHNPETWSFDNGTHWIGAMEHIKAQLRTYKKMCKGFWILGGEPLDQESIDMANFLLTLKEKWPDKYIMIWTRYYEDEWPHAMSQLIHGYASYVKCGRYEEDRPPITYEVEGQEIKLASSNQLIMEI